MRFRVYLAVFLSIILVGMASWVRFSGKSEQQLALEAVDNQKATQEYYEEFIEDIIVTQPSETSAPLKLSSTDLIGRQFLSDYVSLATNGQANADSIDDLAQNYIESIPTLISVESISYGDIKVSSNTRTNLQKYSSELVGIQQEYANKGRTLSPGQVGESGFSPSYYAFMASTASIYRDTASKLKAMEVPTTLVENHFALVNAYLANAVATEAISKTSEDPATAFAGFVLLAESIGKEQASLVEIGRILTSNGV